MPKEIRLNAFLMNTVGGHLAPGQWRAPGAVPRAYLDPGYWRDLAVLLEEGGFDGLFLGDTLGVYDVQGGNADAALRAGAQVPMNDPFPLIPLMSAVTRHLGFGVTASATYEQPYLLARRFTTLDHLTQGRVAWNIVTSYLASGARNMGQQNLRAHDARYDRAEEFMDICYQLWEKSWDTDAVRAGAVYADPTKIRPVRYEGRHFSTDGIFQSEPSPQRTPVLFQAGGSQRGVDFAARHAECVFLAAPTLAGVRKSVSALHDALRLAGRSPDSVRTFAMFTVIVDATPQAARERLAAYLAQADRDGAAALLSGWTGIDLARYAREDALEYVDTDAGQSALAAFSKLDPARRWTVGDALDYVALGGRGPVIAGSAPEVADALQNWVEDTGLDGFNLACAQAPRTYADIVRYLIPELQRRGAYKTSYAPGTWREKLLGTGPHLAPDHPGARIPLTYKAARGAGH